MTYYNVSLVLIKNYGTYILIRTYLKNYFNLKLLLLDLDLYLSSFSSSFFLPLLAIPVNNNIKYLNLF